MKSIALPVTACHKTISGCQRDLFRASQNALFFEPLFYLFLIDLCVRHRYNMDLTEVYEEIPERQS